MKVSMWFSLVMTLLVQLPLAQAQISKGDIVYYQDLVYTPGTDSDPFPIAEEFEVTQAYSVPDQRLRYFVLRSLKDNRRLTTELNCYNGMEHCFHERLYKKQPAGTCAREKDGQKLYCDGQEFYVEADMPPSSAYIPQPGKFYGREAFHKTQMKSIYLNEKGELLFSFEIEGKTYSISGRFGQLHFIPLNIPCLNDICMGQTVSFSYSGSGNGGEIWSVMDEATKVTHVGLAVRGTDINELKSYETRLTHALMPQNDKFGIILNRYNSSHYGRMWLPSKETCLDGIMNPGEKVCLGDFVFAGHAGNQNKFRAGSISKIYEEVGIRRQEGARPWDIYLVKLVEPTSGEEDFFLPYLSKIEQSL